MIKRLVQFFMVVLLPLWVCAKPVDVETARQKAQQFMQGKLFKQAKNNRRMKGAARSSELQSYYIFNAEDNNGFVIVSGDDRSKEILAYSENGNFDFNNIPDNVKWLLEYYEQVIQGLDKKSYAKSVRKSAEKADIAPFITTTWGQGTPYNTQCPTINDEHCLTGCVATAMAQVMNYLQCPEGETSDLGDYTTKRYQIAVDALPTTSFDWENMTDDDIARLMRYCGQSVKMDYGLEESSAFEVEIPYAMMNYFGFDNEMCFAYPSEGWEEVLYEELAEGRPVIYGATSDMGRHAFVCNGYQDGKFYINWGWNGNFDGYYELSVLDVTEDLTYNNDHCAIVHIKKSSSASNEDGDERVFTAQSPEGITLTFSVVSESGKTCRVGITEDLGGMSAINESITGTLTVPSEVEGYQVISIGSAAFFRNHLSEIFLPETITRINVDAFRYSFELSSLTIPKNVSFIPNYGAVFSECPKLREIIVDKDNPVYDSRENCNAVIHTKTNQLVAGCGGTTIPRSVTSIAPQALMDCYGMKNLFLHKDLIDIGSFGGVSAEPFWGCPDLESIVVEEGNPYYASPNNCNALIDMRTGELILGCSQTIIPSEAVFIANNAFYGNKKLTSISIPENITFILNQAFTECSNLEEVTMPSTLTYLGDNAFSQCNLKSVHIPDGIEQLLGTFWNNTNLSTVTGGKDIVEIGNGTFSGCAFESITLGENVETIGDAFDHCYNLKSISIPKGVKSIGREAFVGCYSLESIIIDGENTVYDSRDNCNAIIETATNKMIAGCKNTTFPEDVKSIADRCFEECNDLKEANLPHTLEEIGHYAFARCGIKDVSLPNSLVILGNGAFYGCPELTSVTLPENLGSIPPQTFAFCNKLVSPQIPESVTSVGEEAFLGSGLSSIVFPESVKSIGDRAFQGCLNLSSVTLPNKLEKIFSQTFFECLTLTSINIPGSVTSIEDNAFWGCINLKSVTVEWTEPIPLTSGSTFSNCDNCILYVPDGCKAAYASADYWKDFKEIREMSEMFIPGDVNGDNEVDLSDAIMVTYYSLHVVPTNFNEAAADMNGDGEIDLSDAIIIIYKSLGVK